MALITLDDFLMKKLSPNTLRNLYVVRGHKGFLVKAVQEQLEFVNKVGLEPDGIFGGNTKRAVVSFQKTFHLLPDGIVGPVTAAVLFQFPIRWETRRPPFVRQPRWTCWAASLASASQTIFPSTLIVNDLVEKYKGKNYLDKNDSIKSGNLYIKVLRDYGFKEILKISQIYVEFIIPYLKAGFPLILVDNSTGNTKHARVLYGVDISKGTGEIGFLFMDPMKGYTQESFGYIQSLTQKAWATHNSAAP